MPDAPGNPHIKIEVQRSDKPFVEVGDVEKFKYERYVFVLPCVQADDDLVVFEGHPTIYSMPDT